MSYPAKLMNTCALLSKLESTYGTAVTPAATADGQLMALSDRHQSIFTPEYNYDGAQGPAPGNLGMLKRIAAVGRTATGNVPMRAKGYGAAHTSTELPNIHVMAKISGMDSTIGSGAVTYTPTPDSATYSSATTELYQRGEKWRLRGCLASMGFEGQGAAAPIFNFQTRGIFNTVVADATLAAPTYPTLTVDEPHNVSVAMTFITSTGTWTATGLRSYSFSDNREFSERIDLTQADAHAGWAPAGYDPEFRVTVESTALTYPTTTGGFDPYKMRLNGEEVAVSMTVGSVGGVQWVFAMPQCQVSGYDQGSDGAVATTELVLKPYNSSPIVQDDAYSITFPTA